MQTIPSAWADGLRRYHTPETEWFLRMYDAAEKAPERLAMAVRFELE